MYFITSFRTPVLPRGIRSYFRRLPAFGRKLQFKLFFPLKLDQFNLES